MSSSVFPETQDSVVLCIDDNEDLLDCEKSFLETFGYTVLAAASGGLGLELASQHSVDVVIVDYLTPEMNGHDVAVELRRLRPETPIIMLSASLGRPTPGPEDGGRFRRQRSVVQPAIAHDRSVTRIRIDLSVFSIWA